ncbi:MAG: C-terminal helicase domain-containing protein, partial [Saprospiraceae bacterium]
LQSRTHFFSTKADYLSGNLKINQHEAEKIVELVTAFQQIYHDNQTELTSKSIGIITPYRAQIAQIRKVLNTTNEDYSWLTIDTVERYQGGARDIILISLCTNSASQLESLVSLSDEGVDRKLNVALTRARKHLVVVGNAELLRGNTVYEQLMDTFSN